MPPPTSASPSYSATTCPGATRGCGATNRTTSPSRRPRAVAPSDEADVHALGLRGRAQTEARGVRAHAGLLQLAHGQEHARQLALTEHVQDVGLVLRGVDAAEQAHWSPPLPRDARVMTGG